MPPAVVDEPHPSPDQPLDVLRSLSIGFASGLRSVLPLAVLADQIHRQGPDIADGGWILDTLSRRATTLVLGTAAVGELVADKLPWTPSRSRPLPLAVRVAAGGATAAMDSLAEGRRSDHGALFGSLGALLGSLFGAWLRREIPRTLPLPPLAVAVLEDALGWSLARWATRY